ncbi:MAG: hypothetical protein BMS9Abin36_1408 [Gammaproteobacteria bacterium]|nr:MAG: hypothetical protein BMS9Abin36_1408 [Gammaproteobacteria bacterium]
MAIKSKLTPIAAAVGITVVASLASLPLANAAGNPFAASDLGSGYKVAAEGQCGEGKCGGNKMKGMMKDKKEGKCGEGKMKGKKEGKCGGGKMKGDMKDMDMKGKKEGKCGGKK